MKRLDDVIEAAEAKASSFETGRDLEPLIERLAKSRVVMLGEASHGTHEFYRWRSVISQQLIQRHGFRFIAVEGDWPPCQKVNDYIHARRQGNAREVLESFNRWPTWMWANSDVHELAEWMRHFNSQADESERVGFHGLDVYSLFESTDAVIEQLRRVDPFLARRAQERYACFSRFRHDEIAYARSLIQFPEGCEEQVIQNLREILDLRMKGDPQLERAIFDAQRNARIVHNAESYYRTMVHGNEDSWNVRDRHMMETLDLLMNHHGPEAKGIVWEHNTHIGDHRATDMVKLGQVNIGGLARERYGEENVCLVGFGTDHGSVIASHAWDGPIEELRVPSGREDSYEGAFHLVSQRIQAPQFYLIFDQGDRQGPLSRWLGHRAIGVVYEPRHERWGNYVPTSLAKRYDAFVFIDETRALEPFHVAFNREEFPETWPAGQ